MNAGKSILQRHESGWLTSAPKVGATEVYVLSYHDGRLQAFLRRPGFAERAGSRYCYVIDTSEQRTAWSFTAPSRRDAYYFTVFADVTWRVNDPEGLVRSGSQDAIQVIRTSIEDEMWYIARGFLPDDSAGAERACRQAAAMLDTRPAGLVVSRAVTRVTTDKSLTDATRHTGQELHRNDIDRIHRQLEDDRVNHLRALMQGDDSMILLHLANNRADTGGVISMLMEARQRGESARSELFDKMVSNGFIQDSDVQGLRDSLLGSMGPRTPALPQLGPSMQQPPVIAALPAPQAHVNSGPAPTPGDPPRDLLGPADDPDPAGQAGGVRVWKPLTRRTGN